VKYALLGLIVVVVIAFYAMSQSNKSDAERLKQAEIAHQQKLEQDRLNDARLVSEAKQREIEANNAKTMKAEQEKINSQKVSAEFEQRQVAEKLEKTKEIEDKVRALAFDPESAQFRNQKGNCGEVNAKNKFGGYTGFKKYIYNPETDTVDLESLDKFYTADVMQILWDAKCPK